MNITIKATKTTLTESTKTYIRQKLETLENFIRPEDKIRVELEVDKKHSSGLIFRAEIDIQPHGHFAEARGNDFYEAFDLLIPKIKEQITREKDKQVSLRRRRTKIH
jgi:ribosomal subunit interface protein